MLYELGRQVDPHNVSGDLDAERRLHAERSEAAYRWLETQTRQVVDGMRVLQVRCPDRGCLLGEVYRFPLESKGERFLARAITNRANTVGFINWTFSDGWYGPQVWYSAGCRCGKAKLERAWLLALVGLVRGWHHAMETVEQARARAPEAERRGIARRTFHPQPEAWLPASRRRGRTMKGITEPRPRSNR